MTHESIVEDEGLHNIEEEDEEVKIGHTREGGGGYTSGEVKGIKMWGGGMNP